jgi:hypothetical protein
MMAYAATKNIHITRALLLAIEEKALAASANKGYREAEDEVRLRLFCKMQNFDVVQETLRLGLKM